MKKPPALYWPYFYWYPEVVLKYPHLNTGPASSAALLVCAVLCGCGPRYDDAAALQRQGLALKAAEEYRLFALAKPADPRAPDALLQSARLYGVELGLCEQSRPLLERLARNYRGFKIPEQDFRRIFVCPDYFPAVYGGTWTYGDTETSGRNARQEIQITAAKAGAADASYALYAGSSLVSRQKRRYAFAGFSFSERQGGFDTTILGYPLEKGKTWTSKGPEGRLQFLVEATGLKVKVRAGEFDNCVKIRRRVPGQPSWIYEYYAPWKGKVLTAVGGPGFEHRVTELLKYEEKK